ncbi:MAG: prepilin peptidase [Pseudonocardiaceae bacterium]|nr:prepilin peptidase [Pseudonocardiaceae bacterium]
MLLVRLRGGVTRAWCAVPGVAAVWVVVALVAPPWWWVGVPLALGWLGVLLTITDLAQRRLPDVLTVPAYPVGAALLTVAASGSDDGGLALRGVLGAALWAGGYAAVRLVAPAALGGGDVKLAGPLGALTAAVSWSGLLLAVLAATVITALLAAVAALFGHRDVAHGPAMLGAAWLVVLLSAPT